MNESLAGRSELDELRPLRPRWEWSSDEIRRIGHRVVDMIAEHLTTLPQKHVFRPFPPELVAKYLDSNVPESGEKADDILATFAREIEPYPFGNGYPRFYGWVNSPPAVLGIFAEALAAFRRNVFVTQARARDVGGDQVAEPLIHRVPSPRTRNPCARALVILFCILTA
jgi:hypothetical protein